MKNARSNPTRDLLGSLSAHAAHDLTDLSPGLALVFQFESATLADTLDRVVPFLAGEPDALMLLDCVFDRVEDSCDSGEGFIQRRGHIPTVGAPPTRFKLRLDMSCGEGLAFKCELESAAHSYRTTSARRAHTTKEDGSDACDSYIAHAPTRRNQQVPARETLMATSQLTGLRNAADQEVGPRSTRTDGTIAVLVRSQRITVDCPSWCTHPHAEDYRSLEDVSHHGPAIQLFAPSHNGVIESVLKAKVSSWPFAGDPETAVPFIAFDPVGDEVAQFTPETLAAFADQVIAHGHALHTLAATFPGGA